MSLERIQTNLEVLEACIGKLTNASRSEINQLIKEEDQLEEWNRYYKDTAIGYPSFFPFSYWRQGYHLPYLGKLDATLFQSYGADISLKILNEWPTTWPINNNVLRDGLEYYLKQWIGTTGKHDAKCAKVFKTILKLSTNRNEPFACEFLDRLLSGVIEAELATQAKSRAQLSKFSTQLLNLFTTPNYKLGHEVLLKSLSFPNIAPKLYELGVPHSQQELQDIAYFVVNHQASGIGSTILEKCLGEGLPVEFLQTLVPYTLTDKQFCLDRLQDGDRMFRLLLKAGAKPTYTLPQTALAILVGRLEDALASQQGPLAPWNNISRAKVSLIVNQLHAIFSEGASLDQKDLKWLNCTTETLNIVLECYKKAKVKPLLPTQPMHVPIELA